MSGCFEFKTISQVMGDNYYRQEKQFNDQDKIETSTCASNHWSNYIEPLLNYVMSDFNKQGNESCCKYNKDILMNIFLGLEKAVQESINEVKEWQAKKSECGEIISDIGIEDDGSGKKIGFGGFQSTVLKSTPINQIAGGASGGSGGGYAAAVQNNGMSNMSGNTSSQTGTKLGPGTTGGATGGALGGAGLNPNPISR